MDPLSAIGLASAVVQFIEFGFKVAKRLDEFSSKNPGEVPRSVQAICIQLPLLLNALSRIKTDAQIKNLDFDTKCILRGMVSGCQAQVIEVEAMINEISRVPGDSFRVKIRKVFTSLKYDEKVWEIERNLHTYISVLILHHVVDTTETPLLPVEDTFFDVRETRASPFVQRPSLMQELEGHLHDAARSQVKNPTILHLAGQKGVGKTQLALEYCYQAHLLGQFRTVFWIDASTLENLCLGLEGMYATIKRSMDGSRTEKISFVRGFLDSLWHPWLLILDNYEPAALYNDIMELLPTRGYGGIILITRSDVQEGLGKVLQVPRFLTMDDQNQLNSLLAQAVQRKDFEGIKDLVNQGADVNTLIWDEWPCLHRVALFGLEDAVSFLLERGADPNPPVKIMKPLYWAANAGNASICHLLLDHEDATGQVSKPADNQAAFNAAAEAGSLDAMRMLFTRREVALNHRNRYDETPLQNAARKGHVEIVRFLTEQGALAENHEQADQALIGAASAGNLDIVKILCSSGKVSPNARDGQGMTALCHAAALKDPDSTQENGLAMATFLLEQGADPNLPAQSDSPLQQAAMHSHLNMVHLLLQHGADATTKTSGWNALTTAIKYHRPDAVALLLLHAPIRDPAARAAWLDHALRYACRAGDRGAVLQLLHAGADIDGIVEEEEHGGSGIPKGGPPLLLAILHGHVKTAQLLARRGARHDLADEQGRLPLPAAAEAGYDVLVRDLLRGGGAANVTSGENEDTPLMLAVAGGHAKVVRILLENGAERTMVNRFGEMALDVAEEKGDKDMIELLEG